MLSFNIEYVLCMYLAKENFTQVMLTNVGFFISIFFRNFNVRLRRDTSLFAEDFVLEDHTGSVEDSDTSFFYKGDLLGK